MGTNYYLVPPIELRPFVDRLHLGKSSVGWCFSLRVYPRRGINDLSDWRSAMSLGSIVDEYGEARSRDAMLAIIHREQCALRDPSPEWLAKNHALRGPMGLARHPIDHVHCVGHGEGPWDYIVGDFS